MKKNRYILKMDCADQVGLVAAVTSHLAAEPWNLVEVNQYTDPYENWFFARFVMEGNLHESWLSRLEAKMRELRARWSWRAVGRRTRVAVLVSKADHCLADLLWRWRSGELLVDIPLVVSNHENCRALVEREEISFVQIPVLSEQREDAFRSLAERLNEAGVELVILARYMQILPAWFCEQFSGKLINIHHSFLPAFVGANPYQRAYQRGVKLIGATCHYATPELDAGPIIEQEVVRVEHYHEPEDLQRLGRDCERIALARGVRYHLEDRVLLHGNRAIVFRD